MEIPQFEYLAFVVGQMNPAERWQRKVVEEEGLGLRGQGSMSQEPFISVQLKVS